MSDFQTRLDALSPDKRAVFERLLQQRAPGRGAAPAAGFAAAAARPDAPAAYEAPRTPIEKILASTWEEVLAVPRVGIHDNFFELGGDSIHCIQIVARARRAGLALSNQQIFEFPTVGSLAPRVSPRAEVAVAQAPLIGPVPLLPMQRWLLDRSLACPEHWNQAVLLELPTLRMDALRKAGDVLVMHHDALRLRFERDYREPGGWRQFCVAHDAVALDEHDLSAFRPDEQTSAIERLCAHAQERFDLLAGPVFRLVYFRLAGDQPSRLLLLAHHLVVDAVSFRILIEDLQRALDQAAAGRELLLPLKTASVRDWAEHALRQVPTYEPEPELSRWLALPARPPLPVEFDLGPNVESSAETASVTLDATTTRALVRATASAGANVLHAVLAALLDACHDQFGRDTLLVDLEGHGRDDEASAPDVSRTVGWFTSLYPVALTYSSPGDSPGSALLRGVRDELQVTANRGSRFGLLRYAASADVRARLARVPQPEVMVNYLGHFGQLEAGTTFRLAQERTGPLFAPEDPRPHLWQVVGGLFSGELRLDCIYSRNRHRAETMDRLMTQVAATLRAIAEGVGESASRAALQTSVGPGVFADDVARIAAGHEE
jgi:non-ribosomal peptide synthase protein (TIGR01720 family)